MSSIALIVTAALAVVAPPANVPHFQSPIARALHGEYVIAQQYGDANPRGSDPHGGADSHGNTAHDEIHDSALPANSADNDRQATTDVYGGAAGQNTQHPANSF